MAPGGHQKGAKRDPNAIVALAERLAAFIAKSPGQRIEEIGTALGVMTKELALPVKKLIAAKRISVKGHKRATRYFPAGRGARKKGARSAGGVRRKAKRATAAPKKKAKSRRATAKVRVVAAAKKPEVAAQPQAAAD